MRKFIALSLSAVALSAAGGAAHAQTDAGDAPARAPLTRTDVEQRSAAAFARMDLNQDGKLDAADREARRKSAFDRLDADANGAISYEEFSAQREQRAEVRDRGDGPRMDRRGGRGQGMARAADTNRDGTVTQAEFASAALARFDRVDVNKDGTIGADERPAPRRMMRMRRAGNAG